jgi:hypothetical protein
VAIVERYNYVLTSIVILDVVVMKVDQCVLSGYTGSHVSFIRDFSSITLLLFDHTPNISVPKNNGATLQKP